MSNVEKFYAANASDKPDNVTEQSLGRFSDVLVIGYDKHGNLDARCSTKLADGAEMLWLLEAFKAKLLNGDYSA